MSGTVGAVLDPIFSLRRPRLSAGASAEVTFTTFVARARERHSARRSVSRFVQRAARTRPVLGAGTGGAARSRNHAGRRGAVSGARRAPDLRASRLQGLAPKGEEVTARAKGAVGTRDFRRLADSSGDARCIAGLSSVRQLLRVHHYWRLKGLACDLVILNLHPATYLQELHDELLATVLASSEVRISRSPRRRVYSSRRSVEAGRHRSPVQRWQEFR